MICPGNRVFPVFLLPGVAPKQRPGLLAHRGAGRLRGVDLSGEPADGGPGGVCGEFTGTPLPELG